MEPESPTNEEQKNWWTCLGTADTYTMRLAELIDESEGNLPEVVLPSAMNMDTETDGNDKSEGNLPEVVSPSAMDMDTEKNWKGRGT
jgi:hypothetical protein